MLWEIVGTPHRLLASMHALPEKVVLPDWVAASHEGTKRFVFELDHRNPLSQTGGIDHSGAHLKLPGISEVYVRAKVLLGSVGSNEPFEACRPWKAAFYVLARFLPQFGVSHDYGVDNRFRKLADEQRMSVDFLESPSHSAELIDNSCNKANGGLKFLEHILAIVQSGEAERELQRLSRAWFAGDMADLAAYLNEELIKFPFMYEPIITLRNRDWVNTATRLILDSLPTLFIVGALHTVGTGSFIEQLKNAGFKLARRN